MTTNIKPAEPGADVGMALRAAEQKAACEAIIDAQRLASAVESGEYESAMRYVQAIHIAVARASFSEQVRARFFGSPTSTEGKP